MSFSHTSLQVMKHGCAMSPKKVSNSPCSGVTRHPQPKKIQAASKRSQNHVHCILGTLWSFAVDYRPNGQTINAQVYCDTLQRLRRAIQNKRRGLLSSGVVLLHDNARPHTAQQTTALLQQFRWDIIDNPP